MRTTTKEANLQVFSQLFSKIKHLPLLADIRPKNMTAKITRVLMFASLPLLLKWFLFLRQRRRSESHDVTFFGQRLNLSDSSM
jgi:hypothetical protein